MAMVHLSMDVEQHYHVIHTMSFQPSLVILDILVFLPWWTHFPSTEDSHTMVDIRILANPESEPETCLFSSVLMRDFDTFFFTHTHKFTIDIPLQNNLPASFLDNIALVRSELNKSKSCKSWSHCAPGSNGRMPGSWAMMTSSKGRYWW